MADFASLQKEARRTDERFDSSISLTPVADVPSLTLRKIIDLALLNSREYQTEKETLYRVALQLSFERFDYQLKPTSRGNGTLLNYTHDRAGGETVNRLGIPSGLGLEKALITGGNFVAIFANDVLLTFNGPNGFVADVSSELLFELSQPLLQRDIQFENLTQAERNVVYAARDFARFRKEFFFEFAAQYYSLIREFRDIEIQAQNYFSLVRAFNQAEAEYRAGLVPRVQVDQVEQNLLAGRGTLIGVCNSLEQSLDGLKINIGLPTETLINIDLEELDQLTQTDRLAVAGELIRRSQRRLKAAFSDPNPLELLSTGIVLIDRILETRKLQEQLGKESTQTAAIQLTRARIQIESSRLVSRDIATELNAEINSESPSLPVIFQRTLALTETWLELAQRQLEFAQLNSVDPASVEPLQRRRDALSQEGRRLENQLQQMIEQENLQLLPRLVENATEFRRRVADLVRAADQLNGVAADDAGAEQLLADAIELVSELLSSTQQMAFETGLKPVEIDVDSAMITALALRFDLMNERGILADDWRAIKLAADDLRSILDIEAGQRIATDSNVNQPFNFTFDDSQTALRLVFNAPLNRRGERNFYRQRLLDYQAAFRNLMQLEDEIKFAVRNDLRNLALDREQYVIAVASAALAYERVVSTSLEFRLGTGGVSARDFLEAQTAYTDALSNVASRRIEYVVDRAQLFLSLELLNVDDSGFWEPLYDDAYQPESYFEIPTYGEPVYGCLPCVWYSEDVRRMLCVPSGPATILRELPPEVTASPSTSDQTDPPMPTPRETPDD